MAFAVLLLSGAIAVRFDVSKTLGLGLYSDDAGSIALTPDGEYLINQTTYPPGHRMGGIGRFTAVVLDALVSAQVIASHTEAWYTGDAYCTNNCAYTPFATYTDIWDGVMCTAVDEESWGCTYNNSDAANTGTVCDGTNQCKFLCSTNPLDVGTQDACPAGWLCDGSGKCFKDCSVVDTCDTAAGYACEYMDTLLPGIGSVCVLNCTVDADCPEGWTCGAGHHAVCNPPCAYGWADSGACGGCYRCESKTCINVCQADYEPDKICNLGGLFQNPPVYRCCDPGLPPSGCVDLP